MFISSDTNIWLDFSFIGKINHPFLLDNSYYLSSITYHDEIGDNTNFPKNMVNAERYSVIRECVKENRIFITEVTAVELKLAMRFEYEYRPPKVSKVISIQDSIALAIAKERGWILLSGDSGLREAAKFEEVVCHGTLWIYDELLKKEKITQDEYLLVMYKLLDAATHKKRFLPKAEIQKRIDLLKR